MTHAGRKSSLAFDLVMLLLCTLQPVGRPGTDQFLFDIGVEPQAAEIGIDLDTHGLDLMILQAVHFAHGQPAKFIHLIDLGASQPGIDHFEDRLQDRLGAARLPGFRTTGLA